MIEEEKIDSIGNGKQPAGRRNVLLAWICPPRRVSMRNEEAARVMLDAEFYEDPQAYGYARTLALREAGRITPPPIASCV